MSRLRACLPLAACLLLAWDPPIPGGPPAGAQQKPEERAPARTDRYGDLLPPGAVARLGALRFLHRDTISSLAFSPDGKKLAVGGGEHFGTSATPDYTVRLWDAVTGRELHRLRGHGLAVEALAFSPDSRLLSSASGDALIRLWELDTGREIRQFRGHQGTVYAVAFAPSGGVLASASVDKTIRLWEVSSGKELRRFGERQGGLYGFRRLAVSPDGRVLASALVSGDAVHLWDAATGKVLRCLRGLDGVVNALAFSPDGRAVAAGGNVYGGKGAPRICLWDVATGRETRRLTDDFLETECLAFSPDGKVLTAGDRGDGDHPIHQWDLATGRVVRRLRGHQGGVSALAYSPDGKTLASGGRDSTLRFWDPATGTERRLFPGHRQGVTSLAFSPDGMRLASGSEDQTVCLWETRTWQEVRQLRGLRNPLLQTVFSPDGKSLLACDQAGWLCRWDLASGKECGQFDAEQGTVSGVAYSPEGKPLAAGTEPRVKDFRTPALQNFCVWDAITGARRFKLDDVLPSDSTGFVAWTGGFLSDGRTLLAGKFRLWDLAAGKRLPELQGNPEAAWTGAFSPDGKTLALQTDGNVRLWEVATGGERRRFGNRPPGTGVAFSPDGKLLAMVGSKDRIRLWDLAAGREFPPLTGACGSSCGPLLCLAFAPDGTALVSGNYDGTALVWDLTGPTRQRRPRRIQVSSTDLERLWGDLASDDAARAYEALWGQVRAADRSVDFLRGRLCPSPRRLAQLIADLDSDQFTTRERATQELAALGIVVEAVLRQALADQPSLEKRRRVERLLRELDRSPSLRGPLRAVEVLEYIGTAGAHEVLQTLAKGGFQARLPREAHTSLERLAKRASPMP